MEYDYDHYSDASTSEFNDDIFEFWCSFNWSKKMVELFGEAARIIKYKDQDCSYEYLIDQWNSFSLYCGMTFADPNTLNGEKEALFEAYLDIKNYVWGDGSRVKNGAAARKWFDQWMGEWFLKDSGSI